jgi:predicted nucleic acid-binding protein
VPVLVDTCGWIEWLTDGPLASGFEPALSADDGQLIVPTIVQFELYKWVLREADRRRALAAVALTGRGGVIPLTSDLALHAGDLAVEHRLPLADAVVYATARSSGADLLTCDAHFEGLPGVEYLKKPPSN